MKRLTLHVGSHKTGTTSLQRFMTRNADYFEGHGLFVPIPQHKYPHATLDRTACFLKYAARKPLGFKNWNKKLEAPVEEDKKLVAEAVAQHDHIYLSDERLWFDGSQHPQFWQEVKNAAEELGIDEFQVVVYLRRQDEFIVSLWEQFVQHYLTDSLPEYLIREDVDRLLDYLANLQAMERAFGRENIIVRIYDRSLLAGGDVRRDFIESIGLEWTDELQQRADDARDRNPSLTFDVAEIKRVSNSVPSFKRNDDFLMRPAVSAAVAKDKAFSSMTADEVEEVFARYADDNETIAREFLGRDDGVLFPGASKNRSYEVDTTALLYDMCYFFSEAIAVEHAKNRKLARRLRKLDQRVAKLENRSNKLENRAGKIENRVGEVARFSPVYRVRRFIKNRLK